MAPEAVEKAAKQTKRVVDWPDKEQFRPRGNVAPGRRTPVIRRSSSNAEQLRVQMMTWGLVPSWTKLPPGQKHPDHFRMFCLTQLTTGQPSIAPVRRDVQCPMRDRLFKIRF